jgi:hypothetical protein
VRQYARSRSLSLGRAASQLPTPTRMVNGVVVFDVPADSPPITTERVQELDTDQDVAHLRSQLK